MGKGGRACFEENGKQGEVLASEEFDRRKGHGIGEAKVQDRAHVKITGGDVATREKRTLSIDRNQGG